VIGIGKGTTKLQGYLEGDKRYVAVAELGYETTTLDAEGDIVKEVGYDNVKSITNIEEVLPKFRGEISQVPPLYSAIQIDGKRLYEIARKGEGDDVEIPTRQVVIHDLQAGTRLDDDVIKSGVVFGKKYREAAEEKKRDLKAAADAKAETDEGEAEREEQSGKGKKRGKHGKKKDKKPNLFTDSTVPMITTEENKFEIPQFTLSISCGGGTYIRSLVRDIGYECGSVATMTGLVRTKQGPFVLGDALRREEWTADKIYEAIVKSNIVLEEMDGKSGKDAS
jgi:tRNA pseudouridine55 synthase